MTGGAGFIGSHLVDRLLEHSHDVRILDSLDPQVHSGVPEYLNTDAELVVGDVRDHQCIRRCLVGVDAVIHLAAAVGVGQSMYEIERYTSVNAVGAAVVLEEMSQRCADLAKVVVASSMSIYGEGAYRCSAQGMLVSPGLRSQSQLEARQWEVQCPDCGEELQPIPTSESKQLKPNSIYAVGKRDHEEMFLAWGRAYRVPITALRFFNVYGPRQALSNPYTGVAAIFASRLLNDRQPVVFEDGRQTRDFVDVRDVVDALMLALQPGAGIDQALNVGTGRSVSVLDVSNALARHLDIDILPEIQNTFRAGDIRHCFADISAARAALGFEPRISFEEGFRDLARLLADQQAEDLHDAATTELTSRGLTI